MNKKVHIDVVSPKGVIFSGNVDFAVLPGVEGPFAVYPMHAPIITELTNGPVRVVKGGQEKKIEIKGGFAEVMANRITVAVEQ